MRRLVIASVITIIIGVCTYFILTNIGDETDKKTEETENIEQEEKIELDISYATEIQIEELEEKIHESDEVIVLIGNKDEESTKKVSNRLGKVENIDSFHVYYLEKEEDINQSDAYHNLLSSDEDLSNYMNFTPVILVFRNNTFIGGLPGEVEEKNISNFLKYTEVT